MSVPSFWRLNETAEIHETGYDGYDTEGLPRFVLFNVLQSGIRIQWRKTLSV
jgi:hypothetical protein